METSQVVLVEIAHSSLTSILVRLVKNRKFSIPKVEVEKEITYLLLAQYQKADKLLVDQAMGEIEIMLKQSVDFYIDEGAVCLSSKRGFQIFGRPIFGKKRRIPEIRERLAALKLKRMKELENHIHQDKEITPNDVDGTPPEDWIPVQKEPPVSQWKMEMQKMEERIRRRRAGERLEDE